MYAKIELTYLCMNSQGAVQRMTWLPVWDVLRRMDGAVFSIYGLHQPLFSTATGLYKVDETGRVGEGRIR